MRLATYLSGVAIIAMCSQSTAQTQYDLSNNLSTAERMKNIMHKNYEVSHTIAASNPVDSLTTDGINGQQTIQDQHGKVIKQGDFRDGVLREGFFYKYNSAGNLIEKHIYRNGKYLTKATP